MTSISKAEELLLETLGVPFLAFVLNVPTDDVSHKLQARERVSQGQDDPLEELVSFLGTIPRTDPFSFGHSLGALGEYHEALGTSWPIAARLKAGGDIDLPSTTDQLTSSIATLARDMYPLFLLPAQDDPFPFRGPDITAPLFRHPLRKQFDEAVMVDTKLSQLFPNEDATSGHHGQIYRSTGSGGGIQLAMFADTVLRNGWQLAVHRYRDPTLREFTEQSLAVLGVIKNAVEGKKLVVPALVGVTGIRLPDDKPIQLPWGQLRPVTAADQRLVPRGLGGKLQTTTSDGQHVEIDYAGDVVMELDVPYAVKIGEIKDTAQPWPIEPLSAEIVERHLETLRLALLLVWDEAPRPIVAGTWQVFLDPIETGVSASWRDPRRLPYLLPTALSRQQADSWSEWVTRVDASRVQSVDIAVRRTLLAAAERTDPTDALVDAVIAWENLVGSSQGEPTLRVSAALAWLLGANAPSRQKIRKQVSDLYSLRSKVVHGNKILKPNEAVSRRDEALEITIRALRALFGERNDLLTDCKDSTERSLRLLLNDEAVAGENS